MLIGGTVKKAELIRLGENQDNVLLVHIMIHNTTLILPLDSTEAGNIHLDQFMRFSVSNEVYTGNRSKKIKSSQELSFESDKVVHLPTIQMDELIEPPQKKLAQKPNLDITDQLKKLYGQGGGDINVLPPSITTHEEPFSPDELDSSERTVDYKSLEEHSMESSIPIFNQEKEGHILKVEQGTMTLEKEEPPAGFTDMTLFLTGEV